MNIKKDKSNRKTILGSLGILGVLAIKFKFYLLAAWKALAMVKIGWIISPLITIGVYTMLWGLPYAIAVFILLLTHEMGHWIWMKALGLEPKAPVFIPGIGAYVAMTKLPPDQATHAWVALAGPLIGGVTSAMLFWFGVVGGNAWLMAAGSTGFFLNLFQLVPAKPLDGGFVIQAISKWLLVPGTAVLCMLAACFHSIFLFIIAILSIVSLFSQLARERAMRGEKENNENTETLPAGNVPLTITMPSPMVPATTEQRILITLAYIGLAGMLAYLYWLSSNELIVFMPHQK